MRSVLLILVLVIGLMIVLALILAVLAVLAHRLGAYMVLIEHRLQSQLEALRTLTTRFNRVPCQTDLSYIHGEEKMMPNVTLELLKDLTILGQIITSVEKAGIGTPGTEAARIKGVKVLGRKYTVVLIDE